MDDIYKGKDTVDEFLEHYGVLGMKWGVRNPETVARYKRRKMNKSAKRSKTTGMSDAELRTTLNRLNMDKQYQNLTGSYKTRGKNAVNKILAEVGKNSVRTVATIVTIKAGKHIVELWKEA